MDCRRDNFKQGSVRNVESYQQLDFNAELHKATHPTTNPETTTNPGTTTHSGTAIPRCFLRGLPFSFAALLLTSATLAQTTLQVAPEFAKDHCRLPSPIKFAQPLSCVSSPQPATDSSADVVIYGATPSGIIAAIEAAKLGRHVILLEPSQHIGGMMSNGLGGTDRYPKEKLGGLTAQFFQQIDSRYNGDPTADGGQYFEPHVAEAEFKSMLAGYPNLSLQLGAAIATVAMKGATITGLTAQNGVAYQAREFIDASYTGDLMAAAGVSYTVGRESSTQYNEEFAGVGVSASVAPSPIDPYITPGDPDSGLIPHVFQDDLGPVGSADTAVQSYNYRLCLSWDPKNQVPFVRPASYNPSEFAIFARRFALDPNLTFFDVFLIIGLPNAKLDLNNGSGFPVLGTDEVGESFAYPDGSPSVRQDIEAEQTRYMQSLLYYMNNDPSVPSSIQATFRELGLCKDEFTDNAGWPHQIYVREARRMIGQYVLTLSDIKNNTAVPDSIALGGYNIDSHPVHAVNHNGTVAYEPSPKAFPQIPQYRIPYRILTPKADQATNLLVTVDVSASHIAYDSVRIEPTYMAMGQAAGAAASIAIGLGSSVQDVPYAALAAQLSEDGQVVSLPQLSSTSLTYQPQAVATASNSQSVSFTSTGSAPLSIASIQLSGANASSFVFANTGPSGQLWRWNRFAIKYLPIHNFFNS